MIVRLLLPAVMLMLAIPAAADPVGGEVLIAGIGTPDASGTMLVTIVVVNTGAAPLDRALPDRIAGEIEIDGAAHPVTLDRAAAQPAPAAIAPGGFARLVYTLRTGRLPGSPATLSLPSFSPMRVALTVPDGSTAATPVRTAARTPAAPDRPAPIAPAQKPVDTVLGNLSTYQPTYAVYGPGTDSDARLQLSLQYQLFGRAGERRSWLDGVRIAFTQDIFWDLGRESSPFHNVDYKPEIFYRWNARPITDTIALGGQAGFLHESNGRGGTESRTVNTAYVQPEAILPLGDYRLTLGPRAWVYLGSLKDNPDVRRYRGNAGLSASIGKVDGWKLAATTRLNPGSGKGALDALVSYPLPQLWNGGPRLYLFGQGFVGYGEDLLDYDRRQTRLRVGVGIVR